MSDLVPELRRVAEWLRGWDPDEGKLHTLAADRIESLEAEVERLEEYAEGLALELAKLRAHASNLHNEIIRTRYPTERNEHG